MRKYPKGASKGTPARASLSDAVITKLYALDI